jgi:hypothetical protein
MFPHVFVFCRCSCNCTTELICTSLPQVVRFLTLFVSFVRLLCKCGLKFSFVDRMNYSPENMEEQYVKFLLSNCYQEEPDLH